MDVLWFDLICLLQLHRFHVLEESVLISHVQLLLQLNDVALEETNDCCTSHSHQPVTCLLGGPPQLRIPRVHFQAQPRCVHRISRSLQFIFRSSVSTLISPWPPSFLGWDHHSAVRMMAAANAASTSSTLLSPVGFALRCLPTAEATSCRSWGSVTSRLRSTGGFARALNRRVRAKWPRSLTGADTML